MLKKVKKTRSRQKVLLKKRMAQLPARMGYTLGAVGGIPGLPQAPKSNRQIGSVTGPSLAKVVNSFTPTGGGKLPSSQGRIATASIPTASLSGNSGSSLNIGHTLASGALTGAAFWGAGKGLDFLTSQISNLTGTPVLSAAEPAVGSSSGGILSSIWNWIKGAGETVAEDAPQVLEEGIEMVPMAV